MRLTGTYTITFLLSVFLLLTGCAHKEEEEKRLWAESTDQISLSVKSRYIIKYKADRWQKGFSEDSFWAVRDDLEEFMKIKMYGRPERGHVITGDLTYKIINKEPVTKPQRLKFEVVDIDDKGRVWLYNDKNDLGLIIEI